MKTLILCFLVSFSFAALAEEHCPISHSKNLEDFIKDTEDVPGACEIKLDKKSFKGSSVEEVMKKCADNKVAEKECANKVRCRDFARSCWASFAPYTYPGTSPAKAVQLCVLAGRNEQQCASAVVCAEVAGVGLCKAEMGAINYPGYSPLESVELCVRSGREARDCASRIACTGFKKPLCAIRLGDSEFLGVTKDEAIRLCTLGGRLEDVCRRSAFCD